MFDSINEVKEANRRSGFHFFEADTLRFFSSRIHSELYAGRFFVTSELNFDGTARFYTVREALDDGQISDVGGFQQYTSRTGAHAAAQRAAAAATGSRVDVCESCHLRSTIGVLTHPDGEQIHLCVRCVPNSPAFHFEVYEFLVAG